jgi:hypothetical protein
MKELKNLLFAILLGLISTQTFGWPGMPTPELHVDGRYLKDPCGNNVQLHGVAITPSPWFNGCAIGECRWDNYNIDGCLAYNNAVMDALTNTSNGWHLNYIRLHIDPYWTNTPGCSSGGENDISCFDYNRLVTYTNSVIIPLINHARERGMYVILRPPGVCPNNIAINDAYYNYLVTVWNYLSQHSGLKNVDNVMFELANEPINIRASDGTYGADAQKYYDALKNYFQGLTNLIRNNGANNVVWVPGLGYQSLYRGLASNPVTGSNIAYAVHVYPGYWGANAEDPTSFNNAWNYHVQPIANIAPIAITETDWSPDGNGTWGQGTTSGFGTNLKGRIDASGNASWNLLCPEDLITEGNPYVVTTAFNNYWEACAAPSKLWFSQYACCNLPVSSCCSATPITPYLQVNDGSWQQTSSATVNSGVKVKFGPHPTSGGSWSWSGGGTSGTSREQTIYPTSNVTATATYTNSCGATSSQIFTVNVNGSTNGLVNNGVYEIEFQTDATKALDLYNGSDANGTVIRPWTKNSSTAQRWIAIDAGNGYWRFVSVASGSNRCIDLSSGNTANGTNIQLWDNYNNDAQAWLVTSVGNGYYKIASKLNTSRGWDVPNCVMDGSQNLHLWDYYGTSCQLFKFNYVSLKSASVQDISTEIEQTTFEIYPNPAPYGDFTITLSNLKTENSKVAVFDLQGKKVYENTNVYEGTNNISSRLTSGIFIVQVSLDNSIYYKKLVVQ